MSLAQLIRGKSVPEKFATATSATVMPETGRSVATVAVASSMCEMLDATTAVQRAELEEAINQCCAARGDSEEHRMTLLADCLREDPCDWQWWVDYFDRESNR